MSAGPRSAAGFPRPPATERVPARVRIELGGQVIADTTAAWRVLETWHPPTYYLPEAAFAPGALTRATGSSLCEWKGRAVYFDVRGGARLERDAAWGYPDPVAPFAMLRDHVAIYAGRMAACFVGDERVTPQEGGFYGGWVTPDFVGPFKGGPGTQGW